MLYQQITLIVTAALTFITAVYYGHTVYQLSKPSFQLPTPCVDVDAPPRPGRGADTVPLEYTAEFVYPCLGGRLTIEATSRIQRNHINVAQ